MGKAGHQPKKFWFLRMDESLSVSTHSAYTLIQVGVIVFAAQFAGHFFKKHKIPSVLGELLLGIIIGPYLLGSIPLPLPGFANGLFPVPKPGCAVPVSGELYFLSTLGAILLLFMSGLETDLKMFLKYSLGGTFIGIGGVVLSFVFGDLLGMLLLHAQFSDPRCLFLGILCTATSVGITARILSERHSMETPEGSSIMAAAVIDDVLGIIGLAVVIGIISGSGNDALGVDWRKIAFISGKSILIWLAFTLLCIAGARSFSRMLKSFNNPSSIAMLGIGAAMLLAGVFEQCGLAMIIGAYCAGLGLCRTDISYVLQERLREIYAFLVPVFFVVMGMLVDIRVLADRQILYFGLLYGALAMLAKVIGCMLPSLFMNFNLVGALRIGIGMIPRGEVALIIAGIGATTMMRLDGKDVPIVDSRLLGITLIMTLVTTLAAPPLLSLVLAMGGKGVRRESASTNTSRFPWSSKSQTVRNFLAREVIENYVLEGYSHSDFSHDNTVIQFRKDSSSFTMSLENDRDHSIYSIILECQDRDAYVVKAIFAETIAEIHQVFDKIRRNLNNDCGIFHKMSAKGGPVVPYLADNECPLEEILPENCVLTDLQARNFDEAINEMVLYLHRLGYVKNRVMCINDIQIRERISSTVLEKGLAFPHARSTQVTRLISAVGLFHGQDGDSSARGQIVILTLCPKEGAFPYIQYVAHMASVLLAYPDLDALREIEGPQILRSIFV